jgi:ABC-type sugar transport system substrate-binding protein
VIDAGIPVVTIDRNVPTATTAGYALAHVGADNVLGGEAQGAAHPVASSQRAGKMHRTCSARLVPRQPSIASAGLHNVIDPAGNIEVVCRADGQLQPGRWVDRDRELSGLQPGCAGDSSGQRRHGAGCHRGSQGSRLSAIPIIGFDALPEALLAVRDGAFYGSVEQFPGGQSRTALQTDRQFHRCGDSAGQRCGAAHPKLITTENFDEAERIGEIPQ